MSEAAFRRAFRDESGQAPLAYLTPPGWNGPSDVSAMAAGP